MQPFNRLRLFHWALAGLFALVWLSGEDGELLHVWTGYGLLAVLVLRPLPGLLQVRGFPRLRPQAGNRGEVLFGRLLTLAMLRGTPARAGRAVRPAADAADAAGAGAASAPVQPLGAGG